MVYYSYLWYKLACITGRAPHVLLQSSSDVCMRACAYSPHNDMLFRLAPLAYICHTVRWFSIFIPHERRHWPAYSNPGQFAGRAVLTESRRAAAGRMARRSWIYIVCLGENWFFMRNTWEYLRYTRLMVSPHERIARVKARAHVLIRWHKDCIYQHVKHKA